MNYTAVSSTAAGEVRAHLGRRRETIETLADTTGIAESTLKRRLLGKSPFRLDELAAIAEHFGVSVVSLLQPREDAA